MTAGATLGRAGVELLRVGIIKGADLRRRESGSEDAWFIGFKGIFRVCVEDKMPPFIIIKGGVADEKQPFCP